MLKTAFKLIHVENSFISTMSLAVEAGFAA